MLTFVNVSLHKMAMCFVAGFMVRSVILYSEETYCRFRRQWNRSDYSGDIVTASRDNV